MTHFLADDGEKIHLKISGGGSPLVLLHGWTSSHQEWFPFLGELERRHQVYRWDARGHGGHRLTAGNAPTVTRMARDLHNLLEHYGLSGVTVVGHSMGALTIWQYIRDFGCNRITKLCIIDQSPKLLTDDSWSHGIYGNFDDKRAARFLETLEQDFAEGVLKLTAYGLNTRAREKYEAGAKGWEKSRQMLKTQFHPPLIECWSSLTQADYRDVLAHISVPTLLVYGGESNFYKAESAHCIARQIPQAVLHIYEGTDHSPHQWQRERFTKELIEFVNGDF